MSENPLFFSVQFDLPQKYIPSPHLTETRDNREPQAEGTSSADQVGQALGYVIAEEKCVTAVSVVDMEMRG